MESVVEVGSDSPIRSIFCLKKAADLEKTEETEDCFILGFDPFEQSVDLSKLSLTNNSHSSVTADDEDGELSVLGEKGQVACRDFPHPRHVCVKYPFDKTPHEECCELCYCFICDTAAPCTEWNRNRGPNPTMHCDATEDDYLLRTSRRGRKMPKEESCSF